MPRPGRQYKDTPISWRLLHGGAFEQCLKTIGRWTKVERIVQTEAEATTLTLEFKIVGETSRRDVDRRRQPRASERQ